MIYDSLDQIGSYIAVLPKLEVVLTVLKTIDFKQITPGFHSTKDPFVRFNVIDYKTVAVVGPLEIHHKEIDVQIVLQGKEIAVASGREQASRAGVYDPEKDVCFVDCPSTVQFQLIPEKFLIFFPGEPHRGNYMLEESISCRKVVFKLRV
jgi:YhcH/YjgK/YiaL family protein